MNQMAFNRAGQIRKIHLAARLALKSKRPVVPWVNDSWEFENHKPMKYPETTEQRKASARKYGIREGDYKPHPPDYNLGEYPDLGDINYAVKDPYENWSDPRNRRNFGEPVHDQFYMRMGDKFVQTHVEQYSPLRAGFLFLRTTVIILTVLIGGLFFGPTVVKPLKSKQYPYDFDRAWQYSDPRNFPLTHYTFEPEE